MTEMLIDEGRLCFLVVFLVVVSVLLFWQSLIISPSVNHCCHQKGFTDTCRAREPNSLGKMGYTRLLQNFQKGFGQLFVAGGHDDVFENYELEEPRSIQHTKNKGSTVAKHPFIP